MSLGKFHTPDFRLCSLGVLGLVCLSATTVCAQWPFGGLPDVRQLRRGTSLPRTEITGTARLEPRTVVAGEAAAIVVELLVDKGVGFDESLRIGGLPDAGETVIYGDFENLSDVTAPTNKVLKRFRLPVRFLTPRTEKIQLAVQGMATTRRQQGNASFTSSTSFATRLTPFELIVRELPTDQRPPDFSGAIGTKFTLTQTLSRNHVHPDDLIEATYRLVYDGYFPSNTYPVVEQLSPAFKAYDPKEIARTRNTVTWKQFLQPRTTAATNTARIALSYYNTQTKRYETVAAQPQRLVFVSDQAATTINTALVVTQDTDAPSPSEGTPPASTDEIELRFAPSTAAPVIARLPANTPLKECARHRDWRRVETPQAIGWTR